MFQIRPEQMTPFREAAAKRFEDKMVEQLRKLFPRVCAKLAEPDLREIIRQGAQAAAQFGIVRQCDISRYIGVMFMFGPNFEMSPDSARFRAVLQSPTLRTSGARTRAMCQIAVRALRERTLQTGRRLRW